MSVERHATIRLRKELTGQIDSFLKSEDGKKLGYTSRAQFVAEACRTFLREVKPPYEHVNTYEDHVKIVDYEIRRIISIYFRENGMVWCEAHESDNCPHIDYVLGLPEVKKALERKGWKRRNQLREA